MTGSILSSENLDVRRRKALFRSWHRGMREIDLLLGGFADAHVARLTEEELDQYEALLQALDADLLKWLTGEQPVPERFDTPIFRRVLAHGRAAPS